MKKSQQNAQDDLNDGIAQMNYKMTILHEKISTLNFLNGTMALHFDKRCINTFANFFRKTASMHRIHLIFIHRHFVFLFAFVPLL